MDIFERQYNISLHVYPCIYLVLGCICLTWQEGELTFFDPWCLPPPPSTLIVVLHDRGQGKNLRLISHQILFFVQGSKKQYSRRILLSIRCHCVSPCTSCIFQISFHGPIKDPLEEFLGKAFTPWAFNSFINEKKKSTNGSEHSLINLS